MIAESGLTPHSATMWSLWTLPSQTVILTYFRTTCGAFWYNIDTIYAFCDTVLSFAKDLFLGKTKFAVTSGSDHSYFYDRFKSKINY